MNVWTDFVVSQFIGGQVFLWGVAICLAGCLLMRRAGRAWVKMVARISVLVGIILVVLSAAPLAFWIYGLFFGLLALETLVPLRSKKLSGAVLMLFTGLSLLLVCSELIHSTGPAILFAPGKTLVVLGDSMCMGADPPGKNWPDLLGDLAQLKTRNFSFGGAKLATSLSEVGRIKNDDTLVIIELGGNDLLGGTSLPQFREDLEKMLSLVCGPQRRVVMLELPLPPFYNRFGIVQRELARSHGVTLIPKHYLAKTICTPGATVDGLHLSNLGHNLFAHQLFDLFVPAR